MKNQAVRLLLIVEILFLVLLIGFFLGRNTSDTPIQVSKLPQPTASTAPATSESTVASTAPLGKVNINTADLQELQRLPGIGPVLAQRILDYRAANGPFETISELTEVSGIGLERLNELLDYATIGG